MENSTRFVENALISANGQKNDGDLKFGANTNVRDDALYNQILGKCKCGKQAGSFVFHKLKTGHENERRNQDNTTPVFFCSEKCYREYVRETI